MLTASHSQVQVPLRLNDSQTVHLDLVSPGLASAMVYTSQLPLDKRFAQPQRSTPFLEVIPF